MNSLTDPQLLHEYAEHRSETAFTELVRRHVDFVHSAALRMVCDPHLAEDVTQDVFIALAQNALKLTARPVLSGWLHCTAQNLAANAVRSDVRRRVREQKAATMNELVSAAPNALWEDIAPQLDAALGELNESDRDALLLRYFERKSAQEMAQILGLSDEAAQKRVNRAMDRLRGHFSKRKLAIGASGLAVVISANAVQAAPVGLATAISSNAVLAGAAAPASTLTVAAKAIAMNTIPKTVITATIALFAGAGIYEAHRAADLQQQAAALRTDRDTLNERLQKERAEAANKLAVAQHEPGQPRRDLSELLKLRAEVAKLRSDSRELAQLKATIENDPTESIAKSWLTRVNLLKQRLAQVPDQGIPELQFLSEQDWLNAVKNRKQLETDADFDQALSSLRVSAKFEFAGIVQSALRSYALANNGQTPSDLSQLQPYFVSPVDGSVLQRYQLAQTGVVTEIPAPLADRDDVYYQISVDGINTISGGAAENMLQPALQAFAAANNGQKPADLNQLAPYVTTPAQQAVLQKLIQTQNGRP